MRVRVPSPFATQAAPAPTASRIGPCSMPTRTVSVTPRVVASMRVTVATVAFKTQIDPSPALIAIG